MARIRRPTRLGSVLLPSRIATCHWHRSYVGYGVRSRGMVACLHAPRAGNRVVIAKFDASVVGGGGGAGGGTHAESADRRTACEAGADDAHCSVGAGSARADAAAWAVRWAREPVTVCGRCAEGLFRREPDGSCYGPGSSQPGTQH
jgi:hypothetical protein